MNEKNEINKLSIFILTYKNQDKIKSTLRSIFQQNIPINKSVELVISDDASPCFNFDSLIELLNFFSKSNPSIEWRVVRRSENVGTVKHLNGVISTLSGDIIVPLGADDEFYDKDTLSKIARFFSESDCKIATGWRVIYSEDLSITRGVLPNKRQRKLLESGKGATLDYLLKNGNFISGACTYYRRSVFDELGLFDEQYKLLEDFPFYLNALMKGVEIKHMGFPVVNYRLGGISTSKMVNESLRLDFINLYKSLLKNKHIDFNYSKYFIFKLFKLGAIDLGPLDLLKIADVVFRHYSSTAFTRTMELIYSFWRR